ncbi:unnamed protein product [Lathyrus oleraceus]
MQRYKNMAKVLKFIYTMILFLSIFLLSKEVRAMIKCETDKDCPDISNMEVMIFKCINNLCEVVKVRT